MAAPVRKVRLSILEAARRRADRPKRERNKPRKQIEPGGRSRKGFLTDEIVDAICEAISNGASQEDAAVAAGVTKDRFYAWLRAGRTKGATAKYRAFADRVETAKGEFAAYASEILTYYATEPHKGVTRTEKKVKNENGEFTGETEITEKVEIIQPCLTSLRWLLQHRGQGWIPLSRHEHTGAGAGPVDITITIVDPKPDDGAAEASV